MKPLFLYDSFRRNKEEFVALDERTVRLYVCGPTVYDHAHLGHARSAIAFDLLHRVLKANGYDVIIAKNFTDIDDKIIQKMQKTKQSLETLTQYYIDEYQIQMGLLNILPNTFEPKATQNVDAMIDMIETLLDNNQAYCIENDGIYFDTQQDDKYGSLNGIDDTLDTQSRLDENALKKNQKDFALWKFEKEGEVAYKAPFGKGRPGWHTECSAMIDRHLAHSTHKEYCIDIHAGGADLMFPHHENEATQTRLVWNKELAKYWVHNGFVTINGEKMSKSLGNSFFLHDLLNVYSAEVVRFYMMSTHYRSALHFNEEDLQTAKKRLDKLYRLKKRIYGVKASTVDPLFKDSFLEALNDDLNSAKSLSVIDEFISHCNEKLDEDTSPKSFKQMVMATIEYMADILGVGLDDPYRYFQFGITPDEMTRIDELIQNRLIAKQEKNFEQADAYRDELTQMNISIMDTPKGTVWEKV